MPKAKPSILQEEVYDKDIEGDSKFNPDDVIKDALKVNFADFKESYSKKSDARESKPKETDPNGLDPKQSLPADVQRFEKTYEKYLKHVRNWFRVVNTLVEHEELEDKWIRGFLTCLLKINGYPSVEKHQNFEPPLLAALEKGNGVFVHAFLDVARQESKRIGETNQTEWKPRELREGRIPKIGEATSVLERVLTAKSDKNCLHVAIEKKSELLSDIFKDCLHYPSLFNDVDDDGYTALHYAVWDFDPDSQYREEIRQVVDFSNGTKEFRRFRRSRSGNSSSSRDWSRSKHRSRSRIRRSRSRHRRTRSIQTEKPASGQENGSHPAWTFSYFSAVKLLLSNESGRKALTVKSKDGLTPYQIRLHHLSMFFEKHMTRLKLKESDRREREIRDPIADHIRFICIQHLPREDLVKALYKPRAERQIEFDLTGLANPWISRSYLDRLSEHLRFECILKYVKLPQLTFKTPFRTTPSSSKEIVETSKEVQIQGLQAIFDWLRAQNVRRILKIEVIDDGLHLHTDEAIENCLSGMGIEEWNWRKMDLCSDVIANSTNCAKQISLYSSGNNAVLMGWASPEGFLNKKKFPKLESIKVFVRKGHESQQRLDKSLISFKSKLEQDKREIKVASFIDLDSNSVSSFLNLEGDIQLESDWMACMRAFTTFVKTIPNDLAVPIKFAIIDDGIDNTLDIFDGKIAGGQSFCPYPNSNNLRSSYFVPSGHHGTVMARIICTLCPRAELYVARLEERFTSHGSRRIVAKSAAEAVNWAVDCGVDIISMSWTIETPAASHVSEDLRQLERAIINAEGRHILMFCSASDQGNNSENTCYPGAFKRCITIGAATETGDKISWVKNDQFDFLCPGEMAFNDGTSSAHRSGSSVATSTASGLAGLILHCQQIVAKDEQSMNWVDLKDRLSMISVFDNLCGSGKFPRVKSFFERQRFENTDWVDDPKSLEHLKWLIRRIQPKAVNSIM